MAYHCESGGCSREAFAGVPRASLVLATKLFFSMTEADRGLARAQVFKQLDASLRRLRADYIDLYRCSRYNTQTRRLTAAGFSEIFATVRSELDATASSHAR